MRILAAMLFAASLAACVSSAERKLAFDQADDAKCRSYGVAPGSPPYVQCRLQLDHDRSDRQIANTLANPGTFRGAMKASQD